jgi:hypothetical protein
VKEEGITGISEKGAKEGARYNFRQMYPAPFIAPLISRTILPHRLITTPQESSRCEK